MIEGLEQIKQMVEKYMQVEMPDEVFKKVVGMVKSRTISKGEIVVHVGDVQKDLYFVISGLLRSYYIDINGNDVTRFFMKENSLCCSEILLKQEPSKCCIEALDDCKVLVINERNLRELIEGNMYCMKAYIKTLEDSIVYKIDRESSFLLKSATERYLDFKREYAQLEERVNQAYIASYLGITPVSLSRIRRTIREEA
jgi:CRP-like cAMP-binding protein